MEDSIVVVRFERCGRVFVRKPTASVRKPTGLEGICETLREQWVAIMAQISLALEKPLESIRQFPSICSLTFRAKPTIEDPHRCARSNGQRNDTKRYTHY